MKKFRIIALMLALVMLLSLTACSKKPVAKRYVALEIKDLPASEYVICVSKAIPDGQEILAAINKAIADMDEEFIKMYRTGNVPNSGRARELFEANNVLRENEDDDPINVFTQVYNPFSYGGPYGAYIDGIDAVICSEAAVALGRSVIFNDRVMSFSYQQVKSGVGDILISAVAKSDELAKDFLLSDVYETGKQYMVCLNTTGVEKVKDLSNLTIGVISGRVGEKFINEQIANGNITGATVIAFDTDTEAKTALYNQRIDVIVEDELPAKQTVRELSKGR